MSQSVIVLSVILAIIVSIDANPLERHDVDGRIVNGVTVTDPRENPWMVYVTARNSTSGNSYMCGGVLIHPSWVLTASVCVKGLSSISVSLGAVTRNGLSILGDYVLIPHYSNQTYLEDIALLKLKTPAVLSSTISTIPIYPGVVGANILVTATGWGVTTNGGTSASTNLMKTDLISISNEDCRKTYIASAVSDDILCARGINNDRGTCVGDNGGPLTAMIDGKKQLVGIVNFEASDGCGKGYPDGFARLSVYYPWIHIYIG